MVGIEGVQLFIESITLVLAAHVQRPFYLTSYINKPETYACILTTTATTFLSFFAFFNTKRRNNKMAISKMFILSMILVAFTFSANITPASASSRHLQNFFPPGFPFPFGGGSSPSSGFSFPGFPPFPFFSAPVGNGNPGGYTPPQTTATAYTTATPTP